MLRYFNLDDARDMETWDCFVLSQPASLPFHLSNWLRTIRDTYSFEPVLWGCLDSSMQLQAIAPFFSVRGLLGGAHLVSLPFSDYCSPLASDGCHRKALLDEILLRSESSHESVEIRQEVDEEPFGTCSHFCRQVVELTSNPDDLKKSIDKRTIQYSIRKAERAGVSVVTANSMRGMAEFRRLNLLTRKKHGLPPQPARFFDHFHDHMVAGGKADILLALCDNQAIAAGVFIRHNGTLYYKYSASDSQFIAEKTPNHLLTWAAMERGCREGFRRLDFGRTECSNTGLVRYKEMWGAVSSPLAYSYYPRRPGIPGNWEGNRSYRLMTTIMRRMPNPVLQAIGNALYKYSA